ncbi:hypothetical protein IAG44_38295 [Streptomyces roseirectus]|uniref:Uncharacterized protein n=1 Tax=Streptomyces roseirectus TaxID=2768066 RepID=A0A7H0IPL5_9ACTN|nr:DUF6223 family protein [Streptomyces roseirectus]QNP74731.1 hypothetical protein IAG44_38295 [Streptomyces roseirectus]
MSVRRSLTALPAALLGVLALVAPAAAQVSLAEEDSGGSGRAISGAALLLALAGVAIGIWALRSANTQGPRRALIAVALGLAGAVVAAIALASSDADAGTGNGQGGGVVAVVLALIAMAIGGVAAARSRHTV